jgi:competence protein ComEA
VAAAIVDYRKANGPFREIADLTKVKGVGPKILERNRKSITLGGAGKPPAEHR